MKLVARNKKMKQARKINSQNIFRYLLIFTMINITESKWENHILNYLFIYFNKHFKYSN